MVRRKESVREILHAAGENFIVVHEYVSRQIEIAAPEPIIDPGTEAGEARAIAPRMEKEIANGMQGQTATHRTDDGKVIHTL